jgi:hypothetical protein
MTNEIDRSYIKHQKANKYLHFRDIYWTEQNLTHCPSDFWIILKCTLFSPGLWQRNFGSYHRWQATCCLIFPQVQTLGSTTSEYSSQRLLKGTRCEGVDWSRLSLDKDCVLWTILWTFLRLKVCEVSLLSDSVTWFVFVASRTKERIRRYYNIACFHLKPPRTTWWSLTFYFSRTITARIMKLKAYTNL